MKQPDRTFVIKYFDLIDEFIKVRCCTEEVLTELLQSPFNNKATYRHRIVEACVPDYETEVLSSLAKLDEDYDIEIVEELLYQICIDVNPTMEIHQVSLPSPQGNEAAEDMMLPRGGGLNTSRPCFVRSCTCRGA